MKKNKHKWKYRINVKKKILVLIILGVLVFVGIGFSILESNLGLGGTIEVSKYDRRLYAALQREVNKGYAIKYTGSHQDSMDPTKSTEDIYHFYAESNDSTKGKKIRDKFNVVFAGYCWQMIRTTDTGGVRLLYNGEPEITEVDGKTQYNCGATRNFYHVGDVASNVRMKSVGTPIYTFAKNYTASTNGTTTTFTLVDDPDDPDDYIRFSYDESRLSEIIEKYPYTCGDYSAAGTSCTNDKFKKIIGAPANSDFVTAYKATGCDNIGKLNWNSTSDDLKSLAASGYMLGDIYNVNTLYSKKDILGYNTMRTSYMYSKTINFTGSSYELVNPVLGDDIPESERYTGYYTFNSTSTSGISPYYIVGFYKNQYYYLTQLSLQYQLADKSIMVGTDIISNGNDTYTIKNGTNPAVEVTPSDWLNNYANYSNLYACEGNNDTCSTPIYIGKTSVYSYYNVPVSYFGSSVKYENGKFVLQDAMGAETYFNDSLLSTHHYKCTDINTTVCNSVEYIYRKQTDTLNSYYILLDDPNVTSIDTALDNMLKKNNTDSVQKAEIDMWYENKLKDTVYESKIDDTIYCGDRSYNTTQGKTFPESGWNYNGGQLTNHLYFKEASQIADLSCSNIEDRYSKSNSVARLKYSIGLANVSEIALLNQKYTMVASQNYALMSPSSYTTLPSINYIYSYSYPNNYTYSSGNPSSTTMYLRPEISLIAGTKYSRGDGSMINPYIVDMSE